MLAKELQSYCKSLDIVQESDLEIEGLTDMKALQAKHLVFIKNKKFLLSLIENLTETSNLSMIIDKNLWDKTEEKNELKEKLNSILTTVEVDIALSFLSKPFYELKQKAISLTDLRNESGDKIHSSVQIGENCFIGADVRIGEGTVLYSGVSLMGQCQIGKNCIVYPNVTIYPNVEIGDNARIHSGVVIGADGFGYNYKDGVHNKVWHMGGVKIGNDFEIGANSCVDQGTFSPTLIADGVKLDNHTQVGHNAVVGSGSVLCGHAGLAGSSKLGDFCIIGGYVALGPGVELGAGCEVGGGAKVLASFPAKTKLGGHPARPVKEWLKGVAWVRKESLKK